MKTAIIIPTYNERENLQGLVPQILAVLNASGVDGSIIVVDDSSPDGTSDLAKELSEKHGRIIVITREAKLGIGSAYKDGFRPRWATGASSAAVNDSSAPAVVAVVITTARPEWPSEKAIASRLPSPRRSRW